MPYIYSFVVWPDETWKHGGAMYTYFKLFHRRTEMRFTQEDFEKFRSDMGHYGFILREIERQLYVTPEVVL
jgi:hypothetical protein